jgi:capsular polysaccharide biosynthesis protein
MDYDFKTSADWQSKYEALRKAVAIKAVRQGPTAHLIEISVLDPNASQARLIANAIADNYVEDVSRQNDQQAEILQRASYPAETCDGANYRATALVKRSPCVTPAQ